MNVTDEPQKHIKLPDEPLEIDEEDFYVRAFIKWAIEEQPELKRLEAENTQLRELVLDYEELAAKLCDSRECDGCPFDTKSTMCKHMHMLLRVGELGIGV